MVVLSGCRVFAIVVLSLLSLPLAQAAPAESEARTFSVLTYNLLHHSDSFLHHLKTLVFDEPLPSDRIAPTLALLEHQQADIIALQEATPKFMEALYNAPWSNSYHIKSTLPPAPTGWRRYRAMIFTFLFGHQPWGQAILSKWFITEVHSYPMGRPLLVTTLDIEGHAITVATCHLDSIKENHDERTRQLDQAFKILGSPRHTILLGDFNFGDKAQENTVLQSAYIDVWPELNPGEPGYTHGKSSRRIDRILVKSTVLTPQRAVLIATDSVIYKDTPMHLSDHFGVRAELRIGSNKAGSYEDEP